MFDSPQPAQDPPRRRRRLVLGAQALVVLMAAGAGVAVLLDTESRPRPQLFSDVVERPVRSTTTIGPDATERPLSPAPGSRLFDAPPSFVEVSITRINPDEATLYLAASRCVFYQVTVVAEDPAVPPISIDAGDNFYPYETCTAVDYIFLGSDDNSAPLAPSMKYFVTVTIQDINLEHDNTPVSTTLEFVTPAN